MGADLVPVRQTEAAALTLPLPVPWRDPHSVPRDVLRVHIADLETACEQQPDSPDLWTCLGIAYAMDFRVYPSMQALERACEILPDHFWAQFKRAELNYRLRALPLAEKQTLSALELASNTTEYAICRRQLQEIRTLIRNGTQKPAWTRALLRPMLALGGLLTLGSVVVAFWR